MRERMIEAARDLYLTQGIQGFSMRKVAAECSVTATALYRHFENKSALISAVIEEGFKLFESELFGALSGASPSDRLLHTGLAYARFGLDHPSYYQIIFMSTAVDHGLSELPGEFKSRISPSFLFLVDRVRESRDSGCLPQIDLLELAAMFWSYFHGFVSLQLMGHYSPVLRSRGDFEEFFKRSLKRYIAALAGQQFPIACD